jgi:SPASM domain peptide maturase of grasp-with-spasm system
MRKIDKSKILVLFQNCIPVKGASRSIIYDLQKESFDFIPNDLLEEYNKKELSAIYNFYGKGNSKIITEYIIFLLEKEYIFFVDSIDEADNFPDLNFKYESYNSIDNAIIEYNITNPGYEIKNLIDNLEESNCKDLEIRVIGKCTIEELNDFLRLFIKSCVQNINIFLPYNDKNLINIDALFASHLRINDIVFYNSPDNSSKSVEKTRSKVITTQININEVIHCGNISPLYFNINMHVYKETLEYNNCLNRKIFVGVKGDIKNYPSTTIIYGNINKEMFLDVLQNEQFKSLWNIKKDKIKICQSCEFRYMCSDCRAYTQDPADIYSKPLKCGYDPSTNEWANWSTNVLSKKGIKHYKFENLFSGRIS